jgi:RHS repeat-associated protein
LDGSGVPFADATYAYDQNSNVDYEAHSLAGGDWVEKQHAYDGLDRLDDTSFETGTNHYEQTFDYTSTGNIERVNGDHYFENAPTEQYHYGDPSLPQAVSAITYVKADIIAQRELDYDLDGQLIDDLRVSTVDDAREHRSITYDATGCMRQIDATSRDAKGAPVKDMTTTHVCGQGGRRVLRSTVDYLNGEVSRVIDFAGLAEIRPDEGPDDDGDGYPDGLVFVRVPVGGAVSVEDARSFVDGSQVADESGYIHADIRGSVIAKTAIDGPASMSREAAYGAWGEPVDTGPLARPRHQFVDFEPDRATGYYYMGARVYDPTLRRWLSPDPLLWAIPARDEASGTELNLYSYVSNSPTNYIDPYGTEQICGADGSSASMGCGSTDGSAATAPLNRDNPPVGGKLVSDYVVMPVVKGMLWMTASTILGPLESVEQTAGAVKSGDAVQVASVGAMVFVNLLTRGVAKKLSKADDAVDAGQDVAKGAKKAGKQGSKKTTRAGHNGVEGPVHREGRTTRSGERGVKDTYPDGSVKDMSAQRVKEYVPKDHPSAPPGTKQKVEFENAQAGTKGYKRDPTPEELDEL